MRAHPFITARPSRRHAGPRMISPQCCGHVRDHVVLYTVALEQVRHYIVLKTAICVGVGFVVGLIFSLLRVEVSDAAIGWGPCADRL